VSERSPAGIASSADVITAVNPWWIAASVMLATFMEVLDTTIVTVALPHMAGNLSASNDEATWVVTSYLISNAVVLPASAWFSKYFGRKRFLIACIILFTFASFLCGIAPNLTVLVLARVLQGIGGGALQPLAQTIMLESFPPEKRGVAMSAYGMGIVVAPILGPLVGGWITDHYSWRWIFYINIPIGIIAVLMNQRFLHDPAHIRDARPGRIDMIGFALMAVSVVTLQLILDKGQEDDWFGAIWIRWFTLVSASSFIAFVFWELHHDSPIVDLRVLRNRNFAVGTVLIALVGVAVYSPITIIPQFLQNILGYTAFASGLSQSPRGLGSIVGMILIGYLTSRVDNRKLIGVGFFFVGLSTFFLGDIDLEISRSSIQWPFIMSGFFTAIVFVPLTTTSMAMLRHAQIGNASGIYNLMRNLGGSVGVSLTTTLVARSVQAHQANLVTHLTPYDPAYQDRLHQLQTLLHLPVVDWNQSTAALGIIYQAVIRQSYVLAYIDAFRWLALMCFISALSVFLFKAVPVRRPIAAH
jgi:DHA2 family multidrug resistance protein